MKHAATLGKGESKDLRIRKLITLISPPDRKLAIHGISFEETKNDQPWGKNFNWQKNAQCLKMISWFCEKTEPPTIYSILLVR